MTTKVGPGMAALLCVLATLTACGSDDPHPLADAGMPIPTPVEAEPPIPGSENVSSFYGLLDVMAERVTASAGIVRPVGGECETADILPRFQCTVTFLGEKITYTVVTTPAGRTADYIEYTYEMTPDHLVATRAGIEAALWYEKARFSTRLACDEGLPETALVTPGEELAQRCYATPLPRYGDEPYAMRIIIDDGEITFEPVPQETA